MNKKQRKDLIMGVGILVGVILVLVLLSVL